jgi:hypothetical protein
MSGREARSLPAALHQRTSPECGEGNPIGRGGCSAGPCRWPQLPFSSKDCTEGKAMTPSATPMLIGDSGQPEASETVRFGVDGRVYEIELPARRASELRSMVGRYIRVARKIPSAASRGRRPGLRTQMDQEQPRRIRSRAKQRRPLVSPRGRIPQQAADEYQATVRVAPVASQWPGSAEPEPAPTGGATVKPFSGGDTAHAAQDQPAATVSTAATEADAYGSGHGLTDREKQELRTIADSAKPLRDIVAGQLRTKGLADRDTAGNWWPTDAGRRELASA